MISSMEQCTLKNENNGLNTNIYSYLETYVGQSPNLYLHVVHFFNTSLNQISVVASDNCFPALVSNMRCSIVGHLFCSQAIRFEIFFTSIIPVPGVEHPFIFKNPLNQPSALTSWLLLLPCVPHPTALAVWKGPTCPDKLQKYYFIYTTHCLQIKTQFLQ